MHGRQSCGRKNCRSDLSQDRAFDAGVCSSAWLNLLEAGSLAVETRVQHFEKSPSAWGDRSYHPGRAISSICSLASARSVLGRHTTVIRASMSGSVGRKAMDHL